MSEINIINNDNTKFIKKTIKNSKGETKTYIYQYDKTLLNNYFKDYHKRVGLDHHIKCDNCGREVQKRHLTKHQNTNICKNKMPGLLRSL